MIKNFNFSVFMMVLFKSIFSSRYVFCVFLVGTAKSQRQREEDPYTITVTLTVGTGLRTGPGTRRRVVH